MKMLIMLMILNMMTVKIKIECCTGNTDTNIEHCVKQRLTEMLMILRIKMMFVLLIRVGIEFHKIADVNVKVSDKTSIIGELTGCNMIYVKRSVVVNMTKKQQRLRALRLYSKLSIMVIEYRNGQTDLLSEENGITMELFVIYLGPFKVKNVGKLFLIHDGPFRIKVTNLEV